jgi:hypothetical protein
MLFAVFSIHRVRRSLNHRVDHLISFLVPDGSPHEVVPESSQLDCVSWTGAVEVL